MISVNRRGLMLVMSSPSGAGKTSLSRRVLDLEPELSLSVSVTTRDQRTGEVDGVHYRFIDQAEFSEMVDDEALLEYAPIYGAHYGTPRIAVEEALQSGRDVLFDIDWQGAQQLREHAGADMVGVYILPPSIDELARRLRGRNRDDEDAIEYRLRQVAADVTHWPEYDYVLINHDFEEAVGDVRAILRAERLKRKRQPGLVEFVRPFREVV